MGAVRTWKYIPGQAGRMPKAAPSCYKRGPAFYLLTWKMCLISVSLNNTYFQLYCESPCCLCILFWWHMGRWGDTSISPGGFLQEDRPLQGTSEEVGAAFDDFANKQTNKQKLKMCLSLLPALTHSAFPQQDSQGSPPLSEGDVCQDPRCISETVGGTQRTPCLLYIHTRDKLQFTCWAQ